MHFTFSKYERSVYDQILEAIKKTYRGSILHGSNKGSHASFLMDESGERVNQILATNASSIIEKFFNIM